MEEFLDSAPALLLSIFAGYMLGALPLADRISRCHGVDIFSTGTRLAGSSNVLRSVGKGSALLVFAGDIGKGYLAVVTARFLGVEGTSILLPLFATVVGHWRSVFSGFRGGDSMATLGGGIISLFGIAGVITVMVAMLIALGGQRMPYSSLMSIVFGYTTLVVLNVTYDGDTVLTLGVGGVTGLVLAHAILGHRRRQHPSEWDNLEETEGTTESSGLH